MLDIATVKALARFNKVQIMILQLSFFDGSLFLRVIVTELVHGKKSISERKEKFRPCKTFAMDVKPTRDKSLRKRVLIFTCISHNRPSTRRDAVSVPVSKQWKIAFWHAMRNLSTVEPVISIYPYQVYLRQEDKRKGSKQ